MVDQYKELVETHESHQQKKAGGKDKLAETKRAERELKERLKAEQRAAKEKKREVALQEAAKFRDERALSGSTTKRASKDAREAVKREAHKAGQACEHGIWKCQICYPQPRTGKINHHKTIPVELY